MWQMAVDPAIGCIGDVMLGPREQDSPSCRMSAFNGYRAMRFCLSRQIEHGESGIRGGSPDQDALPIPRQRSPPLVELALTPSGYAV
jgi:hypothetical protein